MRKQIFVQLPESLLAALEIQAGKHSCEVQDLVVWLLTEGVAEAFSDLGPELLNSVDEARTRAFSELHLKSEVKGLVEQLTLESLPEDLVLQVFQRIRHSKKLGELYSRAIGTNDILSWGISEKARINRALGAWIKRCARARHRMEGKVRAKVYVQNELIRTYTPLLPAGEEGGPER